MSQQLRCVSCVAAMASNRGIGNKGKLPWPSLRTDLEFLEKKTITVKDKGKWNAVLFGRKTWKGIDISQKHFPGRLNIVISKSIKTPPRGSHHVCDSVLSAVKMLSAPPFSSTVEEIFVLGGTEVYREAIESSFCHRIYLTEIDKEFDADAFFPIFDKSRYKLISNPSDVPEGVIEENGVQYRICVYERKV
ncbi:dihydrofolate reductase-like isoform X2 [Acropora millepora]|uniref:dihydrofolate reductase-like isoform X2 n=1 Tax=Acropora millepora TaxID=45264 RepID=UPI001CF2A1CB|nr:dihydrofolate reductase-like isoform X2 [Acropora millepora]XP_029190712.2 dihydrofolate reductase-like isoform X2 [Acropora millepora]